MYWFRESSSCILVCPDWVMADAIRAIMEPPYDGQTQPLLDAGLNLLSQIGLKMGFPFEVLALPREFLIKHLSLICSHSVRKMQSGWCTLWIVWGLCTTCKKNASHAINWRCCKRYQVGPGTKNNTPLKHTKWICHQVGHTEMAASGRMSRPLGCSQNHSPHTLLLSRHPLTKIHEMQLDWIQGQQTKKDFRAESDLKCTCTHAPGAKEWMKDQVKLKPGSHETILLWGEWVSGYMFPRRPPINWWYEFSLGGNCRILSSLR